MNKEYCYTILGLPYDSDANAIKNAYRKMTLKYHPDKNNSADAQHKFIQISKAYEYLSKDRVDYNWYLEELKKQYRKQDQADAVYKARVEEIMREKRMQSEADNKEADEWIKFIALAVLTAAVAIYTFLKFAGKRD
ncbi:MAG: DnaJ domain-containing protein [Bacteroidetes bacterium]|nr:DnaJ domain-containing protein [Bacteroidota bacterium]